jgi:hypothetical protein
MNPSDLQQLADTGYVVIENFLPESLANELNLDVLELRALGKFKLAKNGQDGMVQDENTPFRNINYSETCFIGRTNEPEPKSKARTMLYDLLDNLRGELNTSTDVKEGTFSETVPLLDKDMEELMYAQYPQGGYYRRHRDVEPESASNWRKYSLLLYLNRNWTQRDGGQLRIHLDSGGDELPVGELPNFIDIPPTSGTLVLFCSDLVPHEVLDTRKEHMAIVGCFLSSTPSETNVAPVPPRLSFSIDAETLRALRAIREASPRLAAKLKPAPPVNHSGLLGDDFLFPSSATVEPEEEYLDTDARYWKKICAFDPRGHVTTLSLGTDRLQELEPDLWSSALLKNVVTLDIAGTDLTVDQIYRILNSCGRSLRSVFLGGSALNDLDLEDLLPSLENVTTLDLRFNCLETAESLSKWLASSNCQILFLEGNRLGDDGVATLATGGLGCLKELYLGQNQIGPSGAACLAQGLVGPRSLKKLYIDANEIGNEGAKSLWEVLENPDAKPTLENLYFENNGIGKLESLRLGRSVKSVTFMGDGGIFQG